MPIETSCSCGKRFAARDDLAGRAVTCPSCGSSFVVAPLQPPAGVGRPPLAAEQHTSPLYATMYQLPGGVIPRPSGTVRRRRGTLPVYAAFFIAAVATIIMLALSVLAFFHVIDLLSTP